MNQEKIKIEAYNEAVEIANKYQHENKRHSLKQKAFYKKQKKTIEEFDKQQSQNGEHNSKKKQGEDKFIQDHSIFDTKKGQVLFQLQKTYKGDDRFKLDQRFAEDVEIKKLPNSFKQVTSDIDIYNLSDGSDYEQKKKKSKQIKLQKKQEKQLKQAQKLIENKSEQASSDEGVDEEKEQENGNGFGKFNQKESGLEDKNDDSDSDFFTVKQHNPDEESETADDLVKKIKEKRKKDDAKEKSNSLKKKKKAKAVVLEDQQEHEETKSEYDYDGGDAFDDDGGVDFRKPIEIPIDYIDQEAEMDDSFEVTMEEEMHGYLKVLQDLMPEEKLFFQNKKKNLKIINNSFAGYAAMLSHEDSQILTQNKKKKKTKEERRNKALNGDNNDADEGEDEDASSKKKNKGNGFNKDYNGSDSEDEFGRQKTEKAYNLVIPRFDPRQLIEKKVIQTQQREREEKLRELESQKKPKKLTVEAKIEAGIDKKLKNIMKANELLDKNLAEHQKLEGVQQIKKKAPVLKKLKIDADKWKALIIENAPHNEEVEGASEKNKQAAQSQQPKQFASTQKQQQFSRVKGKPVQQLPSAGSTTLGMLFAGAHNNSQDASRSQFKLFG